MLDVQGGEDTRGITIDQVGLCQFRYPITVLDRMQAKQQTVAELTLSVSLPHDFKGTHMSRFIEVMNEHRGELTMNTLPAVLASMRNRLEAESARVESRFTYFVEKAAPVSRASAVMDYECRFVGESSGDVSDFWLGVIVPVTSLCPCSKAISDYGAHNQRGWVNMDVKPVAMTPGEPELIWIEELIDVAERAGSAPVYPLLKREDERFVTMQAYDNPAFVEDIVRDVALDLKSDPRVQAFRVRVENHESIHNHSVFAKVDWTRETEA